ncbi:MAG: MBL fold metallo-hydrolase [Desulfurococcaceae archaeon]
MTISLCVQKYRDYLNHVNIYSNGAIIIGNSFAIDGFHEKPFRIITHAHYDHLHGLDKSISFSKNIIGTPITLDLIETLGYVKQDLLLLYKQKKIPLDYHQKIEFNNEELELYNADHIPGSSQVHVYLKEKNLKIGYTGDFKLTSRTEIMQDLNVLIIEATYGSLLYNRPFKESITQVLLDIVLEGLYRHKYVYIYAYHGKIQEVMSILRDSGVNASFILPDKVYKVAALLETKYGFKYAPYYRERDFYKPLRNNSLHQDKDKYIVFKHFNLARNRRLDGKSLHVVLTGRFTQEPFLKVDDYTYVVSFSDHADFNDLVKYVEKSNPELVVIDNSRPGEAEFLKSALLDKEYCAVSMP